MSGWTASWFAISMAVFCAVAVIVQRALHRLARPTIPRAKTPRAKTRGDETREPLIQRLKRWWLVRKLHVDCVMWDAMLRAGHMAPLGACTSCAPRIARLRTLAFPKATSVHGKKWSSHRDS
jgi:hypothetical protein